MSDGPCQLLSVLSVVNNDFLGECVPGVVHDAVIVVSQAQGVHFLRGQFVEVVLLPHHHVLSLDLHPVVSKETQFYRRILGIFGSQV